jgi:uncharacterized protein with HEPN domain
VIEELTAEHDQVVALVSNVRTAHESVDGAFPAALSHLNAVDWEAMEQIRNRVGHAAEFTASTY